MYVIYFSFYLFCSISFVFSAGISGEDLPKRIQTGFNIALQTNRDHLNAYIEEIRPKLSYTLKHAVPGEMLLSSGFLRNDQDPLDMAGCYIRLGQHLRQAEFLENRYHLAATSFVNAGAAYAKLASALLGEPHQIDVVEIRINLLASAAQCYYWAYCNEFDPSKKEIKRKLASSYFGYARENANLMPAEIQNFWITNIDRDCSKLA